MNLIKILVIMFCSVCSNYSGYCQDRLIKKTGDTINAKVLRVLPNSVVYKLTSGTDSGSVSILKADLNYITYKNGTADTFTNFVPVQESVSHIYKGNYYSSMRLSDRGTEDAKKFYKGYKTVKTATTVSSILAPFYSLIPTAIIASTRPKYENLNCPYPELMNKSEYSTAYRDQAHKMKKKKAWGGFWLGSGILIGTEIAVLGAMYAASGSGTH